MTRVFSARAFTLAFGLGYAAALIFNMPLFRYYPRIRRLSFHDLAEPALGPGMRWYGWIAAAAVVAVFVAALIPKRIGDRIPPAALWAAVIVVLAAAFYREGLLPVSGS